MYRLSLLVDTIERKHSEKKHQCLMKQGVCRMHKHTVRLFAQARMYKEKHTVCVCSVTRAISPISKLQTNTTGSDTSH